MKFFNKGLSAAFFILSATAAQAGILEIRGGAGLSAANPDALEDQANAAANGGIDADDFQTYNADIFINLPAIPLGFGVRQEWLNTNDKGANGSELDLKVQNLSLLVDLRIIDTAFYVGPIVSVGHPSAKIDYNSGSFTVDDDLDADELSYTAGLETGFILSHFLIGAEAGYQSVKLKSADSPSINAKLDLSGVYGKVLVGLTFF